MAMSQMMSPCRNDYGSILSVRCRPRREMWAGELGSRWDAGAAPATVAKSRRDGSPLGVKPGKESRRDGPNSYGPAASKPGNQPCFGETRLIAVGDRGADDHCDTGENPVARW